MTTTTNKLWFVVISLVLSFLFYIFLSLSFGFHFVSFTLFYYCGTGLLAHSTNDTRMRAHTHLHIFHLSKPLGLSSLLHTYIHSFCYKKRRSVLRRRQEGQETPRDKLRAGYDGLRTFGQDDKARLLQQVEAHVGLGKEGRNDKESSYH